MAESIPFQHRKSTFFGYIVQDDFKVNSRLTLNLGLRGEYSGPLVDTQYRLTRELDLTTPIPALSGANTPVMPAAVTALRTSTPIYNGAWIFTDSSHPGNWNPPGVLLEPRLGMAFRVNDKTAIRAGWARYVVPPRSPMDSAVPCWGAWITAVSAPLPTRLRPYRGCRRRRSRIPSPPGWCRPRARPLGRTPTWATRPSGTTRISNRKPTIVSTSVCSGSCLPISFSMSRTTCS